METLEKTAVPATAFASLPESPIRWSTLAVGYLVPTALVVFFTATSISFMAPVLNPIDTQESVHLVAPVLDPPPKEPEPVMEAKEMPARKPTVPTKAQARPPLLTPPIEVRKEVPKVEVAKVTPPTVSAVAKPDAVRSPVLTGSSAPVTLPKPPRVVQTGGFGDPNGVPVNNNGTGKGPVIAKVGSFDLPSGPGTGNGTGGAKGVQGTVASAGFGSGIAGPGDGGTGTRGNGQVRPTNFGNAEPAPSDGPKRPAPTTASKETPVSLLSKPTPTYTLEARQRKIEGDVELEVEFTATGQVRVIRVIRGLGYGLDESAVKAAQNIRFAPARRDGQAVDAQGRLKIVFRLS
jgi:TonB family protein